MYIYIYICQELQGMAPNNSAGEAALKAIAAGRKPGFEAADSCTHVPRADVKIEKIEVTSPAKVKIFVPSEGSRLAGVWARVRKRAAEAEAATLSQTSSGGAMAVRDAANTSRRVASNRDDPDLDGCGDDEYHRGSSG